MAVEFELTITQVNWIGNIVSFVFIPASLSVPYLCSKWGMRYSAYFGGVTLLLSAWVRYAGTVEGLSVKSAYALILLGQVCFLNYEEHASCVPMLNSNRCLLLSRNPYGKFSAPCTAKDGST